MTSEEFLYILPRIGTKFKCLHCKQIHTITGFMKYNTRYNILDDVIHSSADLAYLTIIFSDDKGEETSVSIGGIEQLIFEIDEILI